VITAGVAVAVVAAVAAVAVAVAISSATSIPGRTIALEALRLHPSARAKARARHSEAAPIRAVPAYLFIVPPSLMSETARRVKPD